MLNQNGFQLPGDRYQKLIREIRKYLADHPEDKLMAAAYEWIQERIVAAETDRNWVTLFVAIFWEWSLWLPSQDERRILDKISRYLEAHQKLKTIQLQQLQGDDARQARLLKQYEMIKADRDDLWMFIQIQAQVAEFWKTWVKAPLVS